ncbi:PLD nuclease N-terminal domain-containing protein [Mycobacterium sp. ITM-2016-00316]|uniref:PLD nuclease N-terminal domain-containing protein n=1 Tax=Mycobacterium sp. ITM-2016-00316 TaxID=2099695 RepID=UPI001304A08E|nr:PLD nuclease N-terminal domain-containing protein [Mycobacterium sp. ITM-2016-00316]WNG82056.1 PLD nuclease N-terminal domain-containing protein [Mycobacterium sp. ITM-2016-00316]
MGVVLISVAALLWAWAIGEVMSLDDQHLPASEKGTWLAAVMVLPVVGALAWLLIGRRATQTSRTADQPTGIDYGPSVSRARLRGRGDHRLRNC